MAHRVMVYSCVSFFEDGKCPRERYLSYACPFNAIHPGYSKECAYYGGKIPQSPEVIVVREVNIEDEV